MMTRKECIEYLRSNPAAVADRPCWGALSVHALRKLISAYQEGR